MALRNVLVHVDASESGKLRLAMAIRLAVRHGARLTALYVREYSIAQAQRLKSSELGLVSGKQADALSQDIEQELNAHAAELQVLLGEHGHAYGVETVWQCIEGQASRVVPQYSRYADLTIVGHDTDEDPDLPDEYSFAEAMLFSIGRPLLIVPPSGELPEVNCANATLGRHIAVAWNGSRASARALSDALPLIGRAERTTVLLVDAPGLSRPDRLPTATVLDHLRRHCPNVHGHSLPVVDGPVGELLQSASLEQGADLLVAGAHGRAGLWEKMLGSVTRDLLGHMHLPTLLSC
ncbi:universal stress protein [Trinickia mobilis]|uniref:universal stress protein n=1 Tax=Trinickia mobilis TaxID=2816356 RepID=UPI0021049BA8|nr:universal stress protein [Trinickia mobilis]